MRACLGALVFLFAFALEWGAQAQEAKPPAVTAPTQDVAEQLVIQVQQWFETLGAQGKMPRVFTGVTRNASQLIIELDNLPYDDARRRDFLIWLSQRYELAAYAYATPVALQKAPDRDAVESLDIYASSSDKDVLASYSISRHPSGSISFARASDSSEPAKDHSDGQIFLGLHRSGSTASSGGEEFEKVWATLESKVYWRGVNTQGGRAAEDEAAALISRALQLHASGNCEEALPLGEKAADLLRKRNETQSENFAWALVAQALCHKRLVRVAEAERLYRQAIEIHEKVAGANSRDLAITLDNLAALYAEHGRLAEAEQLRLRALQIFKAVLDPANPHVATALQNLAVLHQYQGRLSEALERYLEALPIAEKAYGPDSRQVGVISDNLAGLYRSQRQLDKAGPLYLRAIAIFQKTLGRDHPDTALALQNYAILLGDTGQSEQAEANLKEALGINEKLYGASHDTIAAALNSLVLHYVQQGQWADALGPARRSAEISVQLADRGKVRIPSEGGQRASPFRRLVQVAYSAGAANSELMDEGYIAAQRAARYECRACPVAIGRAARDRGRRTGPPPARTAGPRSGAGGSRQTVDRGRLQGARAARPHGRGSPKARIEEIGGRIDEIDRSLGEQAPQYAALSKPTPISIAATQALLSPDEVLLQILDLQRIGPVPETGFAWLVTKEGAEWVRLPLGRTDWRARSRRCDAASTQSDGGRRRDHAAVSC